MIDPKRLKQALDSLWADGGIKCPIHKVRWDICSKQIRQWYTADIIFDDLKIVWRKGTRIRVKK